MNPFFFGGYPMGGGQFGQPYPMMGGGTQPMQPHPMMGGGTQVMQPQGMGGWPPQAVWPQSSNWGMPGQQMMGQMPGQMQGMGMGMPQQWQPGMGYPSQAQMIGAPAQNLAMFGQAAQQPVGQQQAGGVGSNYLSSILNAIMTSPYNGVGQPVLPNPQTWQPQFSGPSSMPPVTPPITSLSQVQIPPRPPSGVGTNGLPSSSFIGGGQFINAGNSEGSSNDKGGGDINDLGGNGLDGGSPGNVESGGP